MIPPPQPTFSLPQLADDTDPGSGSQDRLPRHVRGAPTYRSDDFASLMRPCPTTPTPTTLAYVHVPEGQAIPLVMQAAFSTFRSNLAAVNYFHTAHTLALVFATTEECAIARKQQLRVGDNTFGLAAIPAQRPIIHKLTLDRVPSNQPEVTTTAIREAFAPYGRVVEVVPLV